MSKKFLILTADTGFGHRSAANAVAAAFKTFYGDECMVKIVNPALEPSTPTFFRKPQNDYDKTLKNLPDFYNLSYQISNTPSTSTLVDNTIAIFLYRTVYRLLQEFRPDAILSTFNFYQTPVHAILNALRISIPCFTVVTDLVDVHRLWFQQKSIHYFVPGEEVYQQAINCNIPPQNITLSGVPVNPCIALDKRSREQIRTSLGWNPHLTTLLVVGSRRVYHLAQYLEILNHSERRFQLVVACGGDEQTFQQLNEIPWNIPVYLYDYVDNMTEMMLASDILVSKAGGLVVSEGLACGLPLLLLDALPGQEAGNVTFVHDHRCGVRIHSPQEFLAAVHGWLDDETELAFYRQNAQKTGRPGAAIQVAQTMWQSARQNSLTMPMPFGQKSFRLPLR